MLLLLSCRRLGLAWKCYNLCIISAHDLDTSCTTCGTRWCASSVQNWKWSVGRWKATPLDSHAPSEMILPTSNVKLDRRSSMYSFCFSLRNRLYIHHQLAILFTIMLHIYEAPKHALHTHSLALSLGKWLIDFIFSVSSFYYVELLTCNVHYIPPAPVL